MKLNIIFQLQHFLPKNCFGGEAILRYFNKVPFFRVASNVNSRYFYIDRCVYMPRRAGEQRMGQRGKKIKN